MKRDLVYFYPCPLPNVYNAYLQAAIQRLNKNCDQHPYTSLSFALNYSFKYNMNGGACTIHFMPYQNGTAVNMRYSVVQLVGARYEAHANEVNNFVAQVLRFNPQRITLDVNQFLNYEAMSQQQMAQMPNQGQPIPQQPVQQQAPAPAAPAAAGIICSKCGKPLSADSRFCVACGTPVTKTDNSAVCQKCGNPLKPDDRFCTRCGTQR